MSGREMAGHGNDLKRGEEGAGSVDSPDPPDVDRVGDGDSYGAVPRLEAGVVVSSPDDEEKEAADQEEEKGPEEGDSLDGRGMRREDETERTSSSTTGELEAKAEKTTRSEASGGEDEEEKKDVCDGDVPSPDEKSADREENGAEEGCLDPTSETKKREGADDGPSSSTAGHLSARGDEVDWGDRPSRSSAPTSSVATIASSETVGRDDSDGSLRLESPLGSGGLSDRTEDRAAARLEGEPEGTSSSAAAPVHYGSVDDDHGSVLSLDNSVGPPLPTARRDSIVGAVSVIPSRPTGTDAQPDSQDDDTPGSDPEQQEEADADPSELSSVLQRYGIPQTEAVAVAIDVEDDEEVVQEGQQEGSIESRQEGAIAANSFSQDAEVQRASSTLDAQQSSGQSAPLASAVALDDGCRHFLTRWGKQNPGRLACAAGGIAALVALAATAGVLLSSRNSNLADSGESSTAALPPGVDTEGSTPATNNEATAMTTTTAMTMTTALSTKHPPTAATDEDLPIWTTTTEQPPATDDNVDENLPVWTQLGPDIIGRSVNEQSGYVAIARRRPANGVDDGDGDGDGDGVDGRAPPPPVVLAVGGLGEMGDVGVVRVYRLLLREDDDAGVVKDDATAADDHNNSMDDGAAAAARWEQIGDDVLGPVGGFLSSGFGSYLEITPDGTAFAAGAPFLDDFAGAVYIYEHHDDEAGAAEAEERANSRWVRRGREILPDERDVENENTLLGNKVALSADGTRLGVLARPGDGDRDGAVGFLRVYDLSEDGTRWERAGPDFRWSGAFSLFDVATASGDHSLFAIRTAEGARILRLVEKPDGEYEWVQVGRDIPRIGQFSGGNGFLSLSADGTTVAVSDVLTNGPLGEAKVGFVHVHRLNPKTGQWTWMGGKDGAGDGRNSSVADGPSLMLGDGPEEEFGWCLSLSDDGNRLATGGPLHGDGSGLVMVLDWKGADEPNGDGGGGEWVRASRDVVGEPHDSLGRHCSLEGGGDLLAVGSMAPDRDGTGLVRVFELQR